MFPSVKVNEGGWVLFEISPPSEEEEGDLEDSFCEVDLRYVEPVTNKTVVKKEKFLISKDLPVGFPELGLRQAVALLKFVDVLKNNVLPKGPQSQPNRFGVTEDFLKWFEGEVQEIPALERELEVLKKIKSGQECTIL